MERARFFSFTPTAEAIQGKQLFGRRPQSSSILPPPFGLSSPETLTTSSWLTEDLTPFSEFPFGSSLDLGFLWWLSAGCVAPLKLPPLKSLILNAASFSKPFNEKASSCTLWKSSSPSDSLIANESYQASSKLPVTWNAGLLYVRQSPEAEAAAADGETEPSASWMVSIDAAREGAVLRPFPRRRLRRAPPARAASPERGVLGLPTQALGRETHAPMPAGPPRKTGLPPPFAAGGAGRPRSARGAVRTAPRRLGGRCDCARRDFFFFLFLEGRASANSVAVEGQEEEEEVEAEEEEGGSVAWLAAAPACVR